MHHSNHSSFQRFQIPGGRRGGRGRGANLSGPFAMIIALISFVLLLGVTVVGGLFFILIRTVVNLVRLIIGGISRAIPAGVKQSRPMSNRENVKAQTAQSAPFEAKAKKATKPTASSPKTISLQKDASGTWRSD